MEEGLVGWVKGTDTYYPITQHTTDGSLFCACKGFSFRRSCRHLKMFLEGDYNVEVQYQMTILSDSPEDHKVVVFGEKRLNSVNLTIEDVTDNLLKTEQFLTRLLGKQVLLEQIA